MQNDLQMDPPNANSTKETAGSKDLYDDEQWEVEAPENEAREEKPGESIKEEGTGKSADAEEAKTEPCNAPGTDKPKPAKRKSDLAEAKEAKTLADLDTFRLWCLEQFKTPAAAFLHFDVNASGSISSIEFVERCVVKIRGLSPFSGNPQTCINVFLLLLKCVDLSRGTITWHEFIGESIQTPSSEQWVRAAAAAPAPQSRKSRKKSAEKPLTELEQFQAWCMESFESPEAVFRHFDTKRNGRVSCSEFVARCGPSRRGAKACPGNADVYKRMFDLHSADSQGDSNNMLSKRDLLTEDLVSGFAKKRLRELEPFHSWCLGRFDSLDAVFRHFDTNGNGSVSCAEFVERCIVSSKRAGAVPCPGNTDTYKRIFSLLNNDRRGDRGGVLSRAEILAEPLSSMFAHKPVKERPKEKAKPKPISPRSPGSSTPSASKPSSPSNVKAASDTAAPRVTSPRKWLQNTAGNMHQTQALLREMDEVLRENSIAGDSTVSRHRGGDRNAVHRLKAMLTQKSDVVKVVEQHLRNVEHAIHETARWIPTLRRAHRTLWTQLTVCEQRLDLRENRPSQELVRDNFQKALEEEWEITADAREELIRLISKGEQLASTLSEVKHQLVEALYLHRKSLRADRCQLMADISQGSDYDRSLYSVCSPLSSTCSAAPSNPKDAERSTQDPPPDVTHLLARAVQLEDASFKLCQECDTCIGTRSLACREATALTEEHMDRRVRQMGHVKHALQKQLMATSETIQEAVLTFGKVIDVPRESVLPDVTKQQLQQRPEQSSVDSHLDLGNDSTSILSTKLQTTANVLGQLKASGARLQEDLKHKISALRIDGMCRKVTPRYAFELRRHTSNSTCKPPVKNQRKKVPMAVEKQFAAI